MEKIVIVGDGAAGLEFVVKLGRSLGKNKQGEILRLEKEKVYFWSPRLHELVIGSILCESHSADYLTPARNNNFLF